MVLLAVAVCWVIGALFMTALAFLLGYGAECYNRLVLARSGAIAFSIEPMIRRAVADPLGEGFWLFLMILAPIMPPVVFTANVLTDGLLALQSNDYRLRKPLFGSIGALLALGAVIGGISLVMMSDDMDVAPSLGDVAWIGLDAAGHSFGHPLPR